MCREHTCCDSSLPVLERSSECICSSITSPAHPNSSKFSSLLVGKTDARIPKNWKLVSINPSLDRPTYFLYLLKSCASPISVCYIPLLLNSSAHLSDTSVASFWGALSARHILNLSFLGTSFSSGQTQCLLLLPFWLNGP